MNDRQRFLNCMMFRTVDRCPNWEWAFRSDTTSRWHEQGLPMDVPCKRGWNEFLGLDRGGVFPNCDLAEKVGVKFDPIPGFAEIIIKQDERTLTRLNEWGAVEKVSKVGESIPQILTFPVRTRQDFQKYRERLNPQDPLRYPADWEQRKKRWEIVITQFQCGRLDGTVYYVN